MEYLLLVGGFVLLIKGADFFVEGSASVAKKLRVSSMVIGLTVVAMGTSAPECAVSIAASFRGDNAVAVSNVIGSNIFNLMIVCGVCSVISAACEGGEFKKGISTLDFGGNRPCSHGLSGNGDRENGRADSVSCICRIYYLAGEEREKGAEYARRCGRD